VSTQQQAGETERAFVLRLLGSLQQRSIAENREYCGFIARDAEGRLVGTEPRRGRIDSCLPLFPSEEFELVASYHTHGAHDPDADSEVPSADDIKADIEDGTDGYVATPGGRVWLVNSDRARASLLCGLGCIRSDPDYDADDVGPIASSYTLRQLEARSAEF
jgi:hypothetical protein